MPKALLIYGDGIKKEIELDEIENTMRGLEGEGLLICPRLYLE